MYFFKSFSFLFQLYVLYNDTFLMSSKKFLFVFLVIWFFAFRHNPENLLSAYKDLQTLLMQQLKVKISNYLDMLTIGIKSTVITNLKITMHSNIYKDLYTIIRWNESHKCKVSLTFRMLHNNRISNRIK